MGRTQLNEWYRPTGVPLDNFDAAGLRRGTGFQRERGHHQDRSRANTQISVAHRNQHYRLRPEGNRQIRKRSLTPERIGRPTTTAAPRLKIHLDPRTPDAQFSVVRFVAGFRSGENHAKAKATENESDFFICRSGSQERVIGRGLYRMAGSPIKLKER